MFWFFVSCTSSLCFAILIHNILIGYFTSCNSTDSTSVLLLSLWVRPFCCPVFGVHVVTVPNCSSMMICGCIYNFYPCRNPLQVHGLKIGPTYRISQYRLILPYQGPFNTGYPACLRLPGWSSSLALLPLFGRSSLVYSASPLLYLIVVVLIF